MVEGPIGVGKTSLVQRLAESLDYKTLLEEVDDSAFLEQFYRDPRSAAFTVQMHFLLQRSRQLDGLRQRDLFSRRLVADFMFAKDPLFAELNLTAEELKLYQEVYRYMALEAPRPDLVVYLRAPVDSLMQRVRKRARPAEVDLSDDYLARVSEAYARFFRRYDEASLLIVDTSVFNPVESDADYQALLQAICTPTSGRHYFNTPPLAIDRGWSVESDST